MVTDTRTRHVAHPVCGRIGRHTPTLLAVLAVALQIAYPLLDGAALNRVTVAIVIIFAAANVAHAWLSRGTRFAAAMLAVTAGGGFAVEQLGVHTGLPFGSYVYESGLGPTWFGVPPVVALAWTMLAWPAAMAARALVRGRAARVVVGAWALAATDLFLDPQMVHAGYWAWRDRSPHLPGVGSVPLSNYAGWLLAALAISAAVQWLLEVPARADSAAHVDRLPVLLYLWLCVGWILALGVFLGLPAAAAWGALGTAPVVLALAIRVARGSA